MMNPTYQQDNQKVTGRSLVSHRLQVRNKTQPSDVSAPKVTFQCEERQTSSTPNTLPIGSTYNAYITHVEDGPYSFTVQLKSYSEDIQPNIDAMCNRNPPRLNSTPLLPGSNILGRSRTDNKFRRAVVMNVKSNSCKVYYMDYGTTEELPQSEIYILPPAIRDLAQPQAMGFCLANLQSVNLPESCKDVFAKLVLNKQVLFRVTQNELASLTQCCEMFLDGKNVRDVLLNITLPLEYTSQSPPRGREVEVNVSFVDCPSQFFVQYHSDIRILGIIQDALATFCPNQERLQSMSQISIGTPVASLYNFDNMWYRALVIGIEDDSVNVLYVDYGNRDNVRVDQLCYLSRELVTKWRTQAVECCLIGFENATPDSILAQEMENKVLGGHFTLKLQCLLSGSRFVGDLIDEYGESVVKMMNDLAKSLNQVSPSPSPAIYQQPPTKFPQSSSGYGSQLYSYEDHGRGNTGDSGGDGGRNDRFVGGRRSTTETRSYPERTYNKYSEHDDRNVEHYEDNRGGDRFKKKWEDRNGAERSHRRDEGRRDDSRRNDDGERGHRFSSGSGADRSDRGERGNRFSNNTNERGGGRYGDGRRPAISGKKDDNFDDNDNKYGGDKFRSGERKDRFNVGGEGGGRYGGNRDEDHDKSSDHSSTGDKFGGAGNRFGDRGGNRGGDRNSGGGGGGRKFGGDHDNKFGGERKFGGDRGERKFGGDRGDKFGGDRGERKFGGDRGDKFGGRSRDQGDNRSGGGRRNNEKRSFDNSSKSRDYQNFASTPPIVESTDDWEVNDDVKQSSTIPSAPVVREFPNLHIVAGETYDVYFCEMGNDPNDVYVQMEGSINLLDDLRAQIDLEEAALLSNGTRAVSKELLTPGLPVLARFADDNLLYRGVVRNQVSGSVTVLFVDYGNYGHVAITDLYTVTPALASKPIQALRVILNDIKPVSESNKWETDQAIYLPYYDADNVLKLKVDVLKSIDGEIVCVGSLMRTDGKTVSQKLIEDGLAKSASEAPCTTSNKSQEKEYIEKGLTQETEWDNKLDHLVRQILNAKVTKIIDSNSLMLKIQALDRNVECQLDDDRTLSNIPVDSNVIISVSGVEDNRLLISMYDEQGKQLGESACGSTASSICPICPMPVVKQTTLVYVSYFNNHTIFIQCSSMTDEITLFLEKLFERYNTSELDETKEWKTGMLCCAFSEDGNWYRARIIETDKEKYTVLFIDYGNTETVDRIHLRELDSEFLKLPEYSLGVHLPVEWLEKESSFMESVENEELICKFLKNNFGTWIVDLKFKTTDERLINKLVKESIVKEKEILSDIKTVSINSSFTVGSSVPVIVSHVDTPTMFWVHLCNDVNTIEELQQKLQDCVESMPTPKDNSTVFAAQYSEDGMWYRAVATGEGDTVRFIDYGNTDSAPLRKELPADLRNPIEGYAILLYLCVKPITDNWSDEAIKMFETFIDQALTAEIKTVCDKIIVDLKSNDQYISKLLVDGNHASYIEENVSIPQELEYPTLYDVVVLTFSDVNNFYVQLLSDQEKQLDMIYNLGSAEKFEQIIELILGDLIAAKSEMDEQWYRGIIISVDPPQAYFIDYGIMMSITDYRILPDSLKASPPMAIHCSLGLENHESLTEKFAVITTDASRVFRLMYKIIDDPNIVDLQLEDGVGISELLTAVEGPYIKKPDNKSTVNGTLQSAKIIENCIVCHANGPYDFYIHTPSSQGLSEDLIEKMTDAASFPKKEKYEKGDIVAVVSSDDEAWYRCKIIDLEPEVCGCFIDYGNATFVTECRELPEALKSIEPLAIKCSLRLPDGIGGWSADAVLNFTELVNENVHGFNVIVISEGDPWVVELIVNDNNQTKVTEELLMLCPVATPVQSNSATRSTTPIALDLDQSKSDQDEQQYQTPPSTPLSGHCYVTHVNSPTDFFLRDTNTSSNLEKVALALAELENNPKPEPHNIDDLVVAQVDGEYFRAKIIEVNPLKVSLIDVGNTSETSDLIQVPDSIKHIPPTVKNCSLHVPDVYKIILNNKKAEEEFLSITASNVEFTYKMLSEGDRPEVELSLNGENIVHVLSEHLNKNEQPPSIKSETKLAKNKNQPALKLNTPIKVSIPYVKSLKEFYIQEVSPENDLLADKLNQADIFNSCKSLNIGDLVAACSLEDCIWYRAEIINTNPIEVFFVDFGNISVVEEVKELPEDISKIPYRSVLAELSRPEGVDDWNQEANDKFSTISEVTFEFDCTVIAKNDDKPYTVQLSLPNLGDLSKALSSDGKVEYLSTNKLEKQNTSDTISDAVTVKEDEDEPKVIVATEEVKIEDQKEDKEHIQNGNEEDSKLFDNKEDFDITQEISEDFDITQEISEPRSLDGTLSEQIIIETEEDVDYPLNKSDTNSSLNISETNSSISNKKDDISKKVRTPLKVKSVAEIKATAKPRIVTRSLSATSLKTGRSTPSPVHKATKTPVDSKKKSSESSSGSQLRRSVSFEDKIIPGCVSGNLAK